MNFSPSEIMILKELVLQKVKMPQYDDVKPELDSILIKLDYEEVK
jgi:hypothetical protein